MDFLRWVLSADVTGAVTWIGTVAGLVGVGFTFWEARRGRVASEKTAEAVTAAEHRISIGTFAYASAQVDLVIGLVQSSDLASARLVFQSVKRFVNEYPEGASSEDHAAKGTIGYSIKTVEHQLNLGLLKKQHNLMRLLEALSGIGNHLARLEQKSKFPNDRLGR